MPKIMPNVASQMSDLLTDFGGWNLLIQEQPEEPSIDFFAVVAGLRLTRQKGQRFSKPENSY